MILVYSIAFNIKIVIYLICIQSLDCINIIECALIFQDCEAITKVFSGIGFHVEQKNNLRVSEIRETMFNLQKETDLACLALFILTHG